MSKIKSPKEMLAARGKGSVSSFMKKKTGTGGEVVEMLLVTELEPDPDQPRKKGNAGFEKNSIANLASSISELGILSPLLVVPKEGGGYVIKSGNRRWLAAKSVGMERVPCVVKEKVTKTAMLALNLQAENNTIQEVIGSVKECLNEGWTAKTFAAEVGMSKARISKLTKIAKAPEPIAKLLETGKCEDIEALSKLCSEYKKDAANIEGWIESRGDEKILRQEVMDLFAVKDENTVDIFTGKTGKEQKEEGEETPASTKPTPKAKPPNDSVDEVEEVEEEGGAHEEEQTQKTKTAEKEDEPCPIWVEFDGVRAALLNKKAKKGRVWVVLEGKGGVAEVECEGVKIVGAY